MNRPLVRELGWLFVAIIIVFILTVVFFGWTFERTVDIHFHDTYYLVALELFLIPLFTIVCFLLFLVKEIRHRFSRTIPAIIIIVSGLLFVLVLTRLAMLVPHDTGYTIYPPLSALGDTEWQTPPGEGINVMTTFFMAIQVIVTTTNIYVAYRLGLARHQKNQVRPRRVTVADGR